MLRSMTGYGRAEVKGAASAFTIEMRAVNNRYLDVQIKAPRTLAAVEQRIRKAVQAALSRGRIDVFITRTGGDAGPARLTVDIELAGRYLEALRDLKERFGLAGDIDVAAVQALPEIFSREEAAADDEQLWSLLAPGIEQAIGRLRSMREEEGAVLARDISARIDALGVMAETVRDRVPATIDLAQQRLTEAVERILKEPPDPARIAQEIALLAERTDIAEELTRLGSHLAQFRRMLAAGGSDGIGRKLDFLIQELGREMNTIASKALDAGISLTVVNMKAELEKIREQVQNIE